MTRTVLLVLLGVLLGWGFAPREVRAGIDSEGRLVRAVERIATVAERMERCR